MDEKDVVIVGGGPGGLSALVYAVRNGLDAILIEKGRCGGLVTEAPHVDNYLGVRGSTGLELAEKFREHASDYASLNEFEEVTNIEMSDDSFTITTSKAGYGARAVIIGTGSRHSMLAVPGERKYAGRGVSYCATCDGFFFRQKEVVVIGGGNTAVMDALHLNELGCRVKLIHRKAELRAECALKDAVADTDIETIWNSGVMEILGGDVVSGVRIRDMSGDAEREISAEGIFVSIGEIPNNGLLLSLGAEVDDKGYAVTDPFQRTSVSRVYAVGDISGGVKQIVVACSEGSVAALAAFEDLKNPYWSTCSLPSAEK